MTFAANTGGSITPRAVTVTAAASTKGYDGTASSTATPTITGGSLAGGDAAAFSESFANSNAGSGKTLTPAGSVNDGNGGNNYTVTPVVNATGSITVRAITVTTVAGTKTYDGTLASTAVPTISGGSLATGDAAAFSENFSNKNVGTGKTLAPAGSVSDGNGGNNYSVTFAGNASGAVTAKAIIVTAASWTKTYDGTTSSTAVPSAPGVLSGDTTAFTETFDNRNAGTAKTLTATGSVNDGNGGNNYSVTFNPNASGSVNPRPLTVTAAAWTKGYDGTTSASGTPTITGGSLVGADTAAFSEAFLNKNTGAQILAPGGSVNDANGGANYTVTPVVTTGSITARSITVSAVTWTKTYDGTVYSTAIPTISGGSLASGDLAAFTETYDNANPGTGKTLTPAGSVSDGNGGHNYTWTPEPNTTGVIGARLNNPYISLGNGGTTSFIAGQNSWVQIPVCVDNLQDAAGDVGLDYATVQLSFSSSASIATAANNGATE